MSKYLKDSSVELSSGSVNTKTKEIIYLSLYTLYVVSTKRIVLSPGPCLNMEHDLGCGRQGGRRFTLVSLSPFPHNINILC